jgi:acetyl-CoA carboxylase biotin carboxyl carrier protein
MTKPTDIDGELVKKLAGLLDETRLTEIEYSWGEFRLRVARTPTPIQGYAAPAPSVTAAASSSSSSSNPTADNDLSAHPGAVKSPMVGTVYLSPQPGAAAFARVGDVITAGQPLLIIEAMKVMNQIRAPKGGKLSRILVSDSSPVEFGQVVMLIE